MRQVKDFIPSKGGTKPYWCLQNVRLGYGLGPKYPYAKIDWDKNIKQHRDKNFPKGVDVPVYWSWSFTLGGVYRDWGHIAVRMADGRIWTDGKYYANVDSLNKYYLGGRGKYLGWGESNEGHRVIKENTMKLTRTDVSQDYTKVGRKASTASQILHSTKGTHKSLHDGLMRDFYKYGYGKQIRDLEKVVATQKAKIAKLEKELANCGGSFTESDRQTLGAINSTVNWIKDKINNIFK